MENEQLRKILFITKFSQKELADILGVTPQAVNKWSKQKKFSKNQLKRLEGLLNEHEINLNKIQADNIKEEIRVAKELSELRAQDHDEPYRSKQIPFIDDVEVFGTISPAMADAVAMRANTFINIPIFSKGEFAIQVRGNSMKGYINHGDWIVIRRIYDVNRIIYGEPYVICTRINNLRTVKFVNRHEDEDYLWLSPYNIEQFESQEIEKMDILEMYAVEGLFRDF